MILSFFRPSVSREAPSRVSWSPRKAVCVLQGPHERRETKMRAERSAETLIAQHGQSSPPVDVRKLAKSLGVILQSADLGEDVSGVLVRGAGNAVIGVNPTHAAT